MVDIIPGLFESDPKELARKIALVLPYVGCIHVSVADNTLVSAKTVMTGFEQILKPFLSGEFLFEAHLMMRKPETLLRELVTSGFKRIIGHVECDDPREFIADARTYDVEVGLAIDADTDIEMVEPFLEDIDSVLVMMAEVGTPGQEFQPDMIEKIKAIHRNFPDLPIEVECGINIKTVKLAADAGATRIVSNSHIFQNESRVKEAIAELQLE